MRVAMLAHSVNPRGGVVHAMSLSEALGDLGVEAVLHAPDASGRGFFREPRCESVSFPVASPHEGFRERVAQRIEDYVSWFATSRHRDFDLYHAHDGISANALIELKRRGLIDGFVRTVHHIDDYADRRVAFWQHRSIAEADALLVVSDLWRRRVEAGFGREATVVGNGVDLTRFSALNDGREAALRNRYKLDGGAILLALGGVEARKNTAVTLQAFADLLTTYPDARLVIAGGATLLDHSAYQSAFREALAALGPAADRVHVMGPAPDADMPALYRLADAYLSPSLQEGFGLCVIEALASGRPVVASEIEPFTSYLQPNEAHWCDPSSPASVAAAMRAALGAGPAAFGPATAARFPWSRVANKHLPIYERLREPAHA
jgi:glycosyltransferase-like protein